MPVKREREILTESLALVCMRACGKGVRDARIARSLPRPRHQLFRAARAQIPSLMTT